MNKPYNNLFIYYVRGRIRPADEPFGSHYIGNWQEDDTAFLFFTRAADQKVEELVAGRSDLDLVDRFQMSYTDWHGGEVEPIVTEKIGVYPPWNPKAEHCAGDEDRILLDPGVVFGAGNHPTTRDCLAAIERVFEEDNPGRVLDLGTGTGLLALSAARLGAGSVLAVDNNYLAVRTTRENIRMNGMCGKVLAACGCAEDFMDVSADLLLANIHYDIMKQLVASRGFFRKKWFVLSGLLRTEARKIEDRIIGDGAKIVSRWTNEGVWHTFLGTSS